MPLQKKYIRSITLWIFTALLIHCNTIYPQNHNSKEKILHPSPGTITHVSDSIILFPEDSLGSEPSSLNPEGISKDKFTLFLDSLKIRASKKLITKKLYDLLIVSNKPVTAKQITSMSDISFLKYSGKKVRRIEIIRLNAFGTNVNAPLYYEPNKIGSLLNKTHILTNESIIKKSLLFSEGDTISPLIFSDNERLLRKLPFIDDAVIIVMPVTDKDVDVVIITKDLYSLGMGYNYQGINRGDLSVFEKNVLGIGHGLGLEVPYNSKVPNSPGLGLNYSINNIRKTFINLNLNYYRAFGETSYGFNLSRDLISATTKYAGGFSVLRMSSNGSLDSLTITRTL